VREAVRAALREYPEASEKDGLWETGWGPERISGEHGLFLGHGYRIRVRHAVRLEGSAVEVRSVVERRPPGGPRAHRWERVDPRPAEVALLDAVARHLEGMP
jgi:hypothetical protein